MIYNTRTNTIYRTLYSVQQKIQETILTLWIFRKGVDEKTVEMKNFLLDRDDKKADKSLVTKTPFIFISDFTSSF